MRRFSLLALSLVFIGCHKAPPFRIEVPTLATLRSYVPEDMRPLPPPDPKDDARLAMEQSFDPPQEDLITDFRTLESVRTNRQHIAERLRAWKPCLDAAMEASNRAVWSPKPGADKELTAPDMNMDFGPTPPLRILRRSSPLLNRSSAGRASKLSITTRAAEPLMRLR